MRSLTLLLLVATVSLASADTPPKEYKLDPEVTVISPDKSFVIKQYFKSDQSMIYGQKRQIWIFPASGDSGYQLPYKNDNSGAAAWFYFSPNSRWICLGDKICAGSGTVNLYHRDHGIHFSPVSEKPLGDAAWNFFAKQPAALPEQIPRFHKDVSFDSWRDNHYLILTLSGLHFINQKSNDRWRVNWKCAYDLAQKKLVLLPDLIQQNKGKIYFIK